MQVCPLHVVQKCCPYMMMVGVTTFLSPRCHAVVIFSFFSSSAAVPHLIAQLSLSIQCTVTRSRKRLKELTFGLCYHLLLMQTCTDWQDSNSRYLQSPYDPAEPQLRSHFLDAKRRFLRLERYGIATEKWNMRFGIYNAKVSYLPSLPLTMKLWSMPPKQDRITNFPCCCPKYLWTSCLSSMSHRWISWRRKHK
jgi:hypothetical protein